MSDTVQIELSRVQVLELICLLHSIRFKEEHAGRFKRIETAMQKQLIAQSTVEELTEAVNISGEYLDGNFYPEIIGENL